MLLNALQTGLTQVYAIVRRSGFLGTSVGQSIFTNSYFAYKKYLEDPFRALTLRHPEFFAGGNLLDVGANIGYTALLFSRAIDASSKVYAFEPEAFNYSLLERVARSAPARGRVVPVRSAVGNQDGSIELWENDHHHADHRILTDPFRNRDRSAHSVQVPILKLDTFVEKAGIRVKFIKVDVQGYEFPVCQGMERTLARNPDAILALEYMPHAMSDLGFQPEAMLQWLQERGYVAHTLDRSGELRFGIPALTGNGYTDLVFARRRLTA